MMGRSRICRPTMAALSSRRMSIHGGLSTLPGRVLLRRSTSWPAKKPISYAFCIAAAIASLRTRRVQTILSLGVNQTLLTAVVTMFSAILGSISFRMGSDSLLCCQDVRLGVARIGRSALPHVAVAR